MAPRAAAASRLVASHWMVGSLFAAILAKATLPADIEVDFSSYEGSGAATRLSVRCPL